MLYQSTDNCSLIQFFSSNDRKWLARPLMKWILTMLRSGVPTRCFCFLPMKATYIVRSNRYYVLTFLKQEYERSGLPRQFPGKLFHLAFSYGLVSMLHSSGSCDTSDVLSPCAVQLFEYLSWLASLFGNRCFKRWELCAPILKQPDESKAVSDIWATQICMLLFPCLNKLRALSLSCILLRLFSLSL